MSWDCYSECGRSLYSDGQLTKINHSCTINWTCDIMSAWGVFLLIPSYLLRLLVLAHQGRKFFRLYYQPLEPIPNDDWPTPVNDQSLAQNASFVSSGRGILAKFFLQKVLKNNSSFLFAKLLGLLPFYWAKRPLLKRFWRMDRYVCQESENEIETLMISKRKNWDSIALNSAIQSQFSFIEV